MFIYIPFGKYLVTGIIDDNKYFYDVGYSRGRPNKTALFKTHSKRDIFIYKIEHKKSLTLKSIRSERKAHSPTTTTTNKINNNPKSCSGTDLNRQPVKMTEGEYCSAAVEFFKVKELAYFLLLDHLSNFPIIITHLKYEKFTGRVKFYDSIGDLLLEYKLFSGYCNYSKMYVNTINNRKEEDEIFVSYWRMENKVTCKYCYNGLGRLLSKSKFTGGVEIEYPPPNSHRLLPYLKEKDPYFRLWKQTRHKFKIL
jgi:hypothetical protein